MAPKYVTDFVRELTPMAVQIGDQYGIDPALIITQSAIETGWGRDVAGNNYFGVKSHGQPGGQTILTHEEVNGRKVPVYDSFRKYDSLYGSMEDYARFLSENPRYSDVFKSRNLQSQIDVISSSGYATDSAYPDLLKNVSRMVQREMGPLPPGSIPNVVATARDVKPPPVPVTPTPNIAAYRSRPNLREVPLPRSRPERTANVPLPRPRPSNTVAPTPATMSPQIAVLRARDMNLQAALDQRYGNTASVPMPRPRPVSPRDIASAPGTTIATVPTNQRTRLPDIPPPGMANVPLPRSRPVSPRDIASAPGTTIASIPTSGIGQPPATRVVQSVPVRPVQAIDGIGSMPTFGDLQAFNSRPTIPGPNGIPKGQERLAAGTFPQMPTMPGVPQIGQIQVGPPMPQMQTANVPLPMPRPLRPQVLPPIPVAAATPGPRLTNAPLRIMVQRDPPPMLTAVQRLQQQGLAPQDAYDLANLRAQQIAAAGGRYGNGAGSGGVGSYFDRVKRGENASGGSDSSLRSLVG